jgi:hypothetical protein
MNVAGPCFEDFTMRDTRALKSTPARKKPRNRLRGL